MSDPTASTTASTTAAATTAAATTAATTAETAAAATTAATTSSTVGVIVGAVVGGVLGLFLIVVLITLLVCKIQRKRNRRTPPTLPHPDDIHPTLYPESPDIAHGRNSDDVTNDHVDDDDKGKTNIVFIDSDDDLPQLHTGFQNNNKPHHTPDNNNTPHNRTPHNNIQHNNRPHNSTPHNPPKKPLVPKANSESVINGHCDQTHKDQGAGSFPRPRGGSLKPPDEDYIQMVGKSPILSRTLPPPAACKPKPGHGYINILNEGKGTSSESDLDRNSDLYENFNSAAFTPETRLGDVDEDQSAEQEKIPKYINVDKIVPQLTPPQKSDGILCDDDISEDEEQVNYINMENPSLLSPTSEFFTEKLSETGHSSEWTSRPHASHQRLPPDTTAKLPDKSKGKSLNHNRGNEHSAETENPVLFKTGKSNSDISTLSNNSDFPKHAKNSPALKHVARNDQPEKQMELDSMMNAENSDHDDLYENSAEFFNIRPQVSESSLDGAGQIVHDNITADRPITPAQITQKSRKPPAVLPKSMVKNNQGTSDISQLKFRLKKTNTAYNGSAENKQ